MKQTLIALLKIIFLANIPKRGIYIVLLLFLMLTSLSAQNRPPFRYSPPAGDLKWSETGSYKFNYELYMSHVKNAIPSNHDGIMVEFDLLLDFDKIGDAPLLRIGYMENEWIRIMYTNRSVMVARFNNEIHSSNNIICWYTYTSFDRMFEQTIVRNSPDTHNEADFGSYPETWTLRVYFTSRFIFIVSTSKDNPQNPPVYYMTPFYFGVDYSQKTPLMPKFLSRNMWAWIWFGSDESAHDYVVSNMKLYSFNYNDWYQHVQKEFSSPNPETGAEN